ncbi:hypothetical protein [Mucilaginibacter sp.]
MKLRLKAKISALLLLACTPALAQQQFKYKAAVQQVDSGRFYSIALQPDLTAKCQPGLADIRLMDEHSNAVPYLPGNALPVRAQSSYRQLPEVRMAASADSLLFYIAENKTGSGINQLWLTLQNTAVNRTVNVLGGDDLQHWFAVKEQITLQQTASNQNGTFEALLAFPVSTYRYFKIQVNNRTLAPVRILKAGVYLQQRALTDYVPVPVVKFTTTRKADRSLIDIVFRDAYRINKLHLQFEGTKYYRRQLQIYSISGKTREWLQDTFISPANNGDLYISAKTKRLQLIMLNEDNPPLGLKSVLAYQVQQSLVAYLEKQHHYTLYFGDGKATTPRYDLQFFADSINRRLQVVGHGPVLLLPYAKSIRPSGTVPAWVLWIAGGIALLLLLTLTLKMTKEIGKR